MSEFMAGPPTRSKRVVTLKAIWRFFRILFEPLLPYESGPRKPAKDLPIVSIPPTEEQLAQCQFIYDECEARRS